MAPPLSRCPLTVPPSTLLQHPAPPSQMTLCVICLDTLKSPMALPCGKFPLPSFKNDWFALTGVWTRADLERQDMSIATSASSRKLNPTSLTRALTAAHRAETRIASVRPPHVSSINANNNPRVANTDPNAVPGHLRNSVLPALRRIYLDEIQDTPSPPVQPEAEVSKLRAENAILRAYCETWKRRANLHSAVIHGIAKVAREQILSMRTDREQLEQKYQNLKRKHADLE